MILIFQINDNKNSLEILFDKEGLDLLKNVINKDWNEPLKKEKNLYDLDHEHLSSSEWGGTELTPEFTSKDAHEIHSAKIVYLGKDGKTLLNN